MTDGPARSQRQSSGLRAWIVLAALGLMLLCAALLLSRAPARPPVTQQEMEQRAIGDASGRGASRLEKINVYRSTLGQLGRFRPCAWPELARQTVLAAAGVSSHNACLSTTPVWVVELWGDYPPWVFEPAIMVYTASGVYIRSDSGP